MDTSTATVPAPAATSASNVAPSAASTSVELAAPAPAGASVPGDAVVQVPTPTHPPTQPPAYSLHQPRPQNQNQPPTWTHTQPRADRSNSMEYKAQPQAQDHTDAPQSSARRRKWDKRADDCESCWDCVVAGKTRPAGHWYVSEAAGTSSATGGGTGGGTGTRYE